jgi:hypothetical protein
MEYFAELIVKDARMGLDAPFDIVFIDGNHDYEFVSFDLMMSARYLRPGGAIFADNVDQAGVAQAINEFLARHARWTLLGGNINPVGANFAVLFAPHGVEVTSLPLKLRQRDVDGPVLRSLSLDLAQSARGRLRTTVNYYWTPYDHHIAGGGIVAEVESGTIDLDGSEGTATIAMESPIVLAVARDRPGYYGFELELSFSPEGEDNILLHPDVRITQR